jgi:exodeoxyribonuclease VII large subunit
LTDLVADARAATPSAAAELAVPDQADVIRQLDSLATRMASGLGGRTQVASERLGRVSDRMRAAVVRTLDVPRNQLDRLGTALDALSPLKILQRGYSVALSPEGRVLKTRDDFQPGDRLRLRITDGEVPVRVETE